MTLIVRVATYNTLRWGTARTDPDERARRDRVVEVIRQDDTPESERIDVWMLQELASVEELRRLADDTGMECLVGKPRELVAEVACDPGNNAFGLGVMWRPGIEPVPGTLRRYSTGGVYFHGLVKLVLDCGGVTIAVASTHLKPFGGPQIVAEANRVVSNLTRDGLPGLVGSDSNTITGDRVCRDGRWVWHASDPYRDLPWFNRLVHHCKRVYDEATGELVRWFANRDAGDVLWAGGLHDASAVLDTAFEPTVGYWHNDPYPARDVDNVRVTRELVPAVVSTRVLRSDLALAASDHLPREVVLDLDLLDPDAPDLAATAWPAADLSTREGAPR